MIVNIRMNVSEEDRRKIRHALGRSGLATRSDINMQAEKLWRRWVDSLQAPEPRRTAPVDPVLPLDELVMRSEGKGPVAAGPIRCLAVSVDGDVCVSDPGHEAQSQHASFREVDGKQVRVVWATGGKVWFE